MNNPALLRTLIVYAICMPLAVAIGYIATMASYAPTYSDFGAFGIIALVLCAPILLRWHNLLLVASWNMAVTLFFLPGKPSLLLLMTAISLGISLFQRALSSERRFVSAPQITLPLFCLTAVVLFTAKLTGGIGLHALGSDVWGGKKYISLLSGIAAYFALTARRIQPQQRRLYVALFFLCAFTSAIGDLFTFVPSSFNFIFAIFPPNGAAFLEGPVRLGGVSVASSAFFTFMLAYYGIPKIFFGGKLWRPLALLLFFLLTFLGGFRSFVFILVLIFGIQFFLQGMHRTKLLPVFFFMGICSVVIIVPFAGKLPYTFQRSLAFLPNVNQDIKMQADSSADWRWQMVTAVAHQVPDYLLLGKGYALSESELESASIVSSSNFAENWVGAVAGDYHNGPLSVIIPFGVWGVVAFLWFQIASLRALYLNFRYGDKQLQNVNALLFSAFLTHTLIFWSPIFGSLYSDMAMFAGLIGLSISLNGGIAKKPAKKPAPAQAEKIISPFSRRPFAPALSRRNFSA